MADLQTKAVVSEAYEQDGLLYIIVEIYIEDKLDEGKKLRILSRTPLDPIPIDSTDQDIRDAAAGLLEKYFPPDPKIKTNRDDLLGLEVGKKDGTKDVVTIK